jgi:hypothetical protein
MGKGGAADRRWDIQSAKILYALACMQIEWPEVFAYFVRRPSPVTLRKFESWDTVSAMPELRNMWKRYHDGEQAKTNLLGFFDEFIAIIDLDGSGEISVEEFRPIWMILRDAQLTNVDLPDAATVWRPVDELFGDSLRGYQAGRDFIEAMQASAWNDPTTLRVLRAGRRFVNMLWGDHSLGSLVTAKRFPMQFYVHARNPQEFLAANKDLRTHLDIAESGHYGIGNMEVSVERLAAMNAEKRRDYLTRLHHQLVADAESEG